MTRRQIAPSTRLAFGLSVRERDCMIEKAFLDPEIERTLRKAVPAGSKLVVHLNLDDIDDLHGCVAAEANHSDDAKKRRLLDAVCDRLGKLLDEFTEPKSEKNIEADDGSGSVSKLDGDHAAVIHRMLKDAPPFRPQAAPEELVAEFANGQNRMPAFLALYSRGAEALPAVRHGLQAANWHIRQWSAIHADNFADDETLRALIPLLHDPRAEVRVWAVHSLSCERCKNGPNPADVIPLLLERIEQDPNIKVRRQAVAMLAYHRTPDPRVLPIFKKTASQEAGHKLRRHAEQGLKRYGIVGLSA